MESAVKHCSIVDWVEATLSPNDEEHTWGVFEVRDADEGYTYKAVGTLRNQLIRVGTPLILSGTWGRDPYSRVQGAKQFKFTDAVLERPAGREGTVQFLMGADYIGKVTANRLYDKWGDEAPKVLCLRTDEVVEAGFLTAERAEDAKEALLPGLNESSFYMPLVTLFHGIGFPKKLAAHIIKKGWQDPIGTITHNPFCLLTEPGVGFNKCDQLWRRLKKPLDHPDRYEASVWATVMNHPSEVWLSRGTVQQEVSQHLVKDITACEQIVLDAVARRDLVCGCTDDETGQLFIAEKRAAQHEHWVARRIMELTDYEPQWPTLDDEFADKEISAHQFKTWLEAIYNNGMAWLLGSAGTGKSYLSARIIRALLRTGKRVIVCAPTGKAALRLQQLLTELGVRNIEVTTIHRALKASNDGKGFYFAIDGERKFIDADFVVVDEVSMLSNSLAWSLLKAIKKGTGVMMVGDPNQLAPVSKGSILRDWQVLADRHSDFTYGKLTEVRRNGGEILDVCGQIIENKKPVFNYPYDSNKAWPEEYGGNMLSAHCQDETAMQQQLLRMMDDVRGFDLSFGRPVDRVRDVQIVVAVNDNSPVSRNEINDLMQQKLNPDMVGDHAVFKVSDKVICIQNTFVKNNRKKEFFLANGSLGYVVRSEKKRIICEMDDYPGEHLIIPTGTGKGDFSLAYAITGHKMQGSQAPIVITLLSSGNANMVADRGWFYTALTRATHLAILVHTGETAARAVHRNFLEMRKSYAPRWMRKYA
jgi:exodeoxyribonuclease V alpha subunit